MRPRFATLTPNEERTLWDAHQHGPQYQFRNRCLCLLLSHQGQPVGWLKDHFKVSRLTIYNRSGGPVVGRLAKAGPARLVQSTWSRPQGHSNSSR